MKIKIGLIGCDDSTYFDMEMSEGEYELVKRMVQASEEESSYGCMPVMSAEEIKEIEA